MSETPGRNPRRRRRVVWLIVAALLLAAAAGTWIYLSDYYRADRAAVAALAAA